MNSLTCLVHLLIYISSIESVMIKQYCHKELLQSALVSISVRDKFETIPWTSFVPPVYPQIISLRINSSVRHLCKNSLPKNVLELVFIRIELQYIQPGAFYDTKSVNVNIQYNNLRKIEKGIFNGTGIVSLILASNAIEAIEGEAFENMFQLEAINLDNNLLKKYNPDWFRNAQILYDVSMQVNHFIQLPNGVAKHVQDHFEREKFYIFGNLNFDYNRIRKIHSDAFKGLKKFGVVSLIGNDLLKLPENAFKGFKFLFRLYLNNNNFFCIDNNTLQSFNNVARLYLVDNRFNTSCKQNIIKYFNNTRTVVYL